MLSRVAERIYWMARYLERAENTARLVNVYRELMLDLPQEVGLEWRQLVAITGTEAYLPANSEKFSDQDMLKFVLTDKKNPNSVIKCLSAVRENVRTTRDLIPAEGWEHVNELYLFGRKKFGAGRVPAKLHDVLSEVVMRCQQIVGLLAGTMSHGDAYQFARIGRSLERADMTTRIVDVGSTTLIAPGDELPRMENRLWMNVLRSLSAHQMYRQYVRRRIRGPDTVKFLLRDPQFPRTVLHALDTMQQSLTQLPRSEAALRTIAGVHRRLAETDIDRLFEEGLHEYMDALQLEFAEIHEQVVGTWFLPHSHEAV